MWRTGFVMLKRYRNLIVLFCLSAVFVEGGVADAKRNHPEKWYQEQWCKEHNGRMEVVMPDKSRCDCVTATHAVEVEFANKWQEAVGQSLHYSAQAWLKAGIVLIIESERDWEYYLQLMNTTEHFRLKIDVWTVGNGRVRR